MMNSITPRRKKPKTRKVITKRALAQATKTQRRSMCEATLILTVVILISRKPMALGLHLGKQLQKALCSKNPHYLEVLRLRD
jgi:hypothetical protein